MVDGEVGYDRSQVSQESSIRQELTFSELINTIDANSLNIDSAPISLLSFLEPNIIFPGINGQNESIVFISQITSGLIRIMVGFVDDIEIQLSSEVPKVSEYDKSAYDIRSDSLAG